MIMYKKILVPHGGTKAGNLAIEHAVIIAKKFASEIIILHVVEPIPSMYSVSLFDNTRDEFVKESMEILQNIMTRMRAVLEKETRKFANEVKIKIEVLEGYPADQILEYAKNNKINLIVMPKRRLTGLKSLLKLGSVSRKVIEHAICPVMVLEI